MHRHALPISPSANHAPLTHQNKNSNSSSNAERVRLWHLNRAIGQHLSPVALSMQLLSLDNWNRKTLRQTFDGHSLSLELRFYFLSLYHMVENMAGWKLGFITINFSQVMTDRLSREAARAPATCYADLINKRLRKRGVSARWFCVLEDHQGNLHSHCVIAYHQDAEQAVRDCFKQDTDLTNSGFRLQHGYKQRCKAMSKLYDQQEVFTQTDCLGKYRYAPIDIGVSDYMSKTLEKPSNFMDSGRCRIYASQQVRTAAKTRYESARVKQKRFSLSHMDLSSLNCHQAMTYLSKGWIPEFDAGNDRRYEAQASEIDDFMASNDFSNSSPAYDWQYEEGEAEVEAYWDTERRMATEPSEREYEKAVGEAEAALDKELKSQEPSDWQYEENVVEAAMVRRQLLRDQEPSERDYERLVKLAEAFLDEQSATPSPPESNSADDEHDTSAMIRMTGFKVFSTDGNLPDWSCEHDIVTAVLPSTLQNVQERCSERQERPRAATPYPETRSFYRRILRSAGAVGGYHPVSQESRRRELLSMATVQTYHSLGRRQLSRTTCHHRFDYQDTG